MTIDQFRGKMRAAHTHSFAGSWPTAPLGLYDIAVYYQDENIKLSGCVYMWTRKSDRIENATQRVSLFDFDMTSCAWRIHWRKSRRQTRTLCLLPVLHQRHTTPVSSN